MEQEQLYEKAIDFTLKAALIHHIAEVIMQVDVHEVDHKALASIVSDEAQELRKIADLFCKETEPNKQPAKA